MSDIPVYTIGYGARDIESFLSVLKAHKIDYLIDLRSRPYSRYKPEFSKEALATYLEAQGVRYIYMGNTLGGQPDDRECYTDGKVDYEKVATRAFYQQGISRLEDAFRQQISIALMCSEGKPQECHRSKLIGKTLAAAGIPVQHIDENDRLISQEDALLRLNRGQPSLFGDDFQQYTSRKRYRQGQDDD